MREIDKAFVADAIIAVKKEAFQENYVTVAECNQIAQKLQERLKASGIEAILSEEVNHALLEVNQTTIQQRKLLESFDLSRWLEEEVRKVIYDKTFILKCLQERQKIRLKMIEACYDREKSRKA